MKYKIVNYNERTYYYAPLFWGIVGIQEMINANEWHQWKCILIL